MCCLVLFAVLALGVSVGAAESPAQRRQALLSKPADTRALIEALADPNAVVRRTAARLLLQARSVEADAIAAAFASGDALVRRAAVHAACGHGVKGNEAWLLEACDDVDGLVRHAALEALVDLRPRTSQINAALAKAQQDESDIVRQLAVRTLWPFERENVSLRQRKDYDHDVTVTRSIPLSKDGWKFRLDPKRDGHLKKWFKAGLDDSGWADISIEQAWQKAGYEHTGVAWYRRTIELPDKPELTAVDLHFQGVDECAWVWLNGVYIGKHDMGPEGWNKPFFLDITREARWGQPNQLTVRAMNTRSAGGIWRPIVIDVLK